MKGIGDYLSGLSARMLFEGLRGVRAWGVVFGIALVVAIPLTPVGFIPVLHPGLAQLVIAVFSILAIVLSYVYRETKVIVYERALAIVWVLGLFFMYYELGGVDSPYLLTITFPLLVESAVANVFWLTWVSVISIVIYLMEAAFEFQFEGSRILFPFIYNTFVFILFILYFNVIVRSSRGYVSGGYGGDDNLSAVRSRTIANERASYTERLIDPMRARFHEMMSAIDEARSTKNLALQDALLGLLYEQLYDARGALRAEGEELLREIELPSSIDPWQVVKDVVASLEPLRSAEGSTIDIQPEDKVSVRAGRVALAEVLHAIMENALLYSPQGEIRIVGAQDKGVYRITIEDDGIGIPEDFMSNVFVRGARAPNAVALRPGRRGQGLPTAQMLANSFGATVEIVPRGDKRGVRASVATPLSWS